MTMKLGRRVDLIKKLARTLSEDGWDDINVVLTQAGLPTDDRWEGDAYSYCTEMLGRALDDTLLELDDYLHGPTAASAEDAPWQTDDLKLFISHLAAHKGYASLLKARLELYGIESFVAHEDIEPNKEWQQAIEAALRSCDACVALLHKGFPSSKWCDQEIGFVFGRNVPVVPVNINLQPYGFLAKIQSIPAAKLDPFKLAREVAKALLCDPRTGAALTERMVLTLVGARSFDHANTVSTLLADHAPAVTATHVAAIQEAREENSQVGNAYAVASNLKAIMKKFNITAIDLRAATKSTAMVPVAYDPSEEPF